MDTILQLFTKKGLKNLFDTASTQLSKANENSRRIFDLRASYENSIESVIAFLQDQDPTLSHFICTRNFLPEASKFEQLEDVEWAFGTMGIRDQARHIATLYLEDLGDLIVDVVDPHFGFSRYAERLGLSAHSFDTLYSELQEETSFISDIMLSILKEKIESYNPTLVGLSVPFPGNLFAALQCAKWLKAHHPEIKIVMGGGYPNTELRSLSEVRVFEFVDFISLDDGETPLMTLLSHLESDLEASKLKRTLTLVDGVVTYCNGSSSPDIKQEVIGCPDYSGLALKGYLSVIQLTNPMHRLWSDGRWNKLTMAHGCYWGKCTFCDISLDYIQHYEASTASTLADRIESLIEQTGERGFHFVDEAAPPALMKALALEILNRKLVVNWWTNIRFEKSFTYDLCRLLAASGCIAISGGLEVASDRLLKLIAKGVSIEQVSRVNENFNRAGVMVHAYLMYGFPTQTDQETIDSLEVVRQMFEEGIMQSAFWHRFAMTAHSPVGLNPNQFKVKNLTPELGIFANNDLEHEDPTGANHDLYGKGLEKSLYNYMHGLALDHPLQNWFDHKVPKTSLPPDLIAKHLSQPDGREIKPNYKMLWIGGPVKYNKKKKALIILNNQESLEISCPENEGVWLSDILKSVSPGAGVGHSYKSFREAFEKAGFDDFMGFLYGHAMEDFRECGLLII